MKRWTEAAPFLLVLIGLFMLQHAPFAGLRADDHGFHYHLSSASWSQAWEQAKSYVPGRNLYILYYTGLYKILGPSPVRLHLAGLFLDLLNVLLAYLLLRRLKAPAAWAFAAAGLFLVYPNHGETHYWTSAVAMNLLSTTMILLAFLAGGEPLLSPRARMAAAGLLWVLALFNYDQAFLLWIPLLYYMMRLAPTPRPSARQAWLFGAAALALNLSHVLLRIFVPVSSGGRPTIQLAHLPSGFADSLSHAFVPLRKLPRWEHIQSFLGGPELTLAAIVALSALWLHGVARLAREDVHRPSPRPFLVLGGLWFLCAYFPNWFWYIAPRHNYLPSLGTFMMLVPLAWTVSPARAKPVLAAAGFLLFGLSTAATLAQGYGWRKGAEEHRRYQEWSVALLGRRADNIFLIGAPRSIAGAPVFDWPGEPTFLFHQATGHRPAFSDVQVSPARTGVFHQNQPQLFGDNLYFTPYAEANLLLHSFGSYSCAREIAARPPGLEAVRLRLPGGTRCRSKWQTDVPVWLVSARPAPAAGGIAAANGAALVSAVLSEAAGFFDLELLWQAERPIAREFASIVRLLDESGRVVFEPVYSLESFGRREHPALWPAYNDLHPPTRWKTRHGARETYRMRLARPLPPGPLRARLRLFERTDGRWSPVGEIELPVARRRVL